MNRFMTIRFSFFLTLCVALLTACAQPRTQVRGDAPYYILTAEEVFSSAYGAITDKYIDRVTPATLAMKGMRGLATIDPQLSVSREGRAITLVSIHGKVAKYQAPAEDNAQDWAILTAVLIEAGRKASRGLREASSEKIYKAVFDGALSGLDSFSRYAGAETARKNRARRNGYGGVGVRLRKYSRVPRVMSVMPKTPAARAGVKPGDYITYVGDISVVGMSFKDVIDQLRGPVGSQIRLTLSRAGEPKPLIFAIKREHIIPNTVTYGFEDGVVILKVSGFNQNTAKTLKAKLMEAFDIYGYGIRGWVLDMRGNPGGLLKQSIKIADMFLEYGDIINTRGRHPNSNQHYEADGDDLAEGLPLVVLMDGKSASSAEVVAVALQDQGRAVVIGTASYGKGTVQTVIRLPNNGEITLTWSRLIAPSGYAFHELGVLPSICTSGETDGEGLAVYDPEVRDKTSAAWGEWRAASLDDKFRRETLRASCPPERRRNAVEVEVALRLLGDPALFERTLDLSSLTAEAGGP